MEKTQKKLNNNPEQAKDFGALFQLIKDDLTRYVDRRMRHSKLGFLEKLSKSSSLLAFGIMVAFCGLAAFSFALIAIALYIGELIGNTATGFGIVALFWIILLIVLLIFGGRIKDFFLNRTVRILYKMEEEDEDEH